MISTVATRILHSSISEYSNSGYENVERSMDPFLGWIQRFLVCCIMNTRGKNHLNVFFILWCL